MAKGGSVYKPEMKIKGGLPGNHSSSIQESAAELEWHFQPRVDFGEDEVSGWFLGTRAENAEIFSQFINEAIDIISYRRKSFHPEDPSQITQQKKASPKYLGAIQSLSDNFYRLVKFLNKYSVPFYSMRYQGHMLCDLTLPSMIGYFTEMLQNSNNVSTQASTATILLEQMATEDICSMIGYGTLEEDKKNRVEPWGHITCDGSVANLEAVWSAREMKLLPISIRNAILDAMHDKTKWKEAEEITVILPDGTTDKLINLDNWKLINLTCDEILHIPKRVAEAVYKPENPDEEKRALGEVWETLTSRYTPNAVGLAEFTNRYLDGLNTPAVVVPSSKHYSWPKAASVLGLGKDTGNFEKSGIINIYVDENARMDIDLLRSALHSCVKSRKPVLMVVAVVGSTEEGAVDPLEKILKLRNEFRKKYNFDFNIHCDAAWGGYMTSIIREDYDLKWPEAFTAKDGKEKDIFIQDTSNVPLTSHVIDQLKHIRFSDSATIDPHKMGYIPYPAGTISYRNKDIINLVTYSAPYIGGGDALSALGQSGIEGSRPGAAASSIFLSHSVIRPSVKGHGKIVARSLKNARKFFKLLQMMDKGYEDKFIVVPLAHDSGQGPDMNIVNYAFNFVDASGRLNDNIDLYNLFNQKIFCCHNITPGEDIDEYNLLITMTTFKDSEYGTKFTDTLKKRIGLTHQEKNTGLNYLRSVIMTPWTADTYEGGKHLNFFEAVIIPALRETVLNCVQEMRKISVS